MPILVEPFETALNEELEKAGLALCLLPTGSIVATARLVRCNKIEAEPDGTPFFRYWPTAAEILQLHRDFPGQRDYRAQRVRRFPEAERKELLFGDWTPGRYAWELTDVKLLQKPIRTKGVQGLWNWDEKDPDSRPLFE